MLIRSILILVAVAASLVGEASAQAELATTNVTPAALAGYLDIPVEETIGAQPPSSSMS